MASISTSAMTLSSYIVAFAGAAKTAQLLMSNSEDPMTIKEFKFKVNLTADSEIASETEVGLNIWRMNLKQKLSLSYKEHLGLEIECTLAPAWSIKAE